MKRWCWSTLTATEAGARVVASWARNLEKIGVKLVFRSVDFALYQQRLQSSTLT